MRPYPIGNGSLAPRIPSEFAALIDALQFRGANTDALLQLERKDWEKLLNFCDFAHLTLPLAQVASRDFPTWVIRRLEKNVADNTLRFERVKASYLEAVQALQKAQVEHVALKGFTQAPDYVKSPRLRMQGDLDLYVLREHIETGQKALQEIGYTPVGGIDYQGADHTPTLSRTGNWKWNGNMFDPDMPVSIELHFCLWNDCTSFIKLYDFEEFWGRRITRSLDDFSFSSLSPVDQLGYFTLHIMRGVISGDWVVHHVYELAAFLNVHSEDHQFWADWERIHSPRFRNVQAIVFGLAESWFSSPIHDSPRRQIDSLPAFHKEWLNRFGGSPLEVAFRWNKDGRLLHLLLLETWDSRRTILRRATLPASFLRFFRPKHRIKDQLDEPPNQLNRHLGYLMRLSDRLISNVRATTEFLSHGACLWLSRRQLRLQSWPFST
jgi:Uncharacterised nucleotidyltransferase